MIAEDHIQFAVAQVLDELGVLWFHTPNEALGAGDDDAEPRVWKGARPRRRTLEEQRRILRACQLVAQGVKAGVVDVLILTTPPALPGRKGLALELKSARGTLEPEQRVFLERARADGFETAVEHGTHAALARVEACGWDVSGALARLEARGWVLEPSGKLHRRGEAA